MASAYLEFAWARRPLAIPLIAVLACVQGATFLAEGAGQEDDIEAMHQAWFKAVTVSLVLGSLVLAGSDRTRGKQEDVGHDDGEEC